MRPSKLGTPDRDLGLADLRPLVGSLLDEIERLGSEVERLSRPRGTPAVRRPLSTARQLLARLSERTADAVTLERQRVLHRAMDEVYFRVEIEPGQGLLSGAATTLDAATFAFNFEDYPAAAGSNRRRNVRRRDLWPKTFVRMNLWYTSPVGSTLTFTVGPRVRQAGTGMSLATPSLIANPTANIPGPAVANDILFATITTTVSLLPSPEVVGLTFSRLAPDANPNALRVLLVEFVAQEVA